MADNQQLQDEIRRLWHDNAVLQTHNHQLQYHANYYHQQYLEMQQKYIEENREVGFRNGKLHIVQENLKRYRDKYRAAVNNIESLLESAVATIQELSQQQLNVNLSEALTKLVSEVIEKGQGLNVRGKLKQDIETLQEQRQ